MKKILPVILALIILLIPCSVFAEDNTSIYNPEFDNWQGGAPDGWIFYSPTGALEKDSNGSPVIYLSSKGFGLLTQEITLKPETCYLITCSITSSDITSDSSIAANINFAHQGAYSSATEDTLSIYVRTNTCETQQYLLRIGLGDEYNLASGNLILDNIIIEELSIIPENMPVYTIIGEIGTSYDSEITDATESENSSYELSYNDIGPALCCLLFMLALYLFAVGRNGKITGNFLASRMNICIIFVIAFLLRIFIALKTEPYPSDMNCFLGWSNMTHEYGLSGFYESGLFADYPPGYMYVLWILGGIQKAFNLDWFGTDMLLLMKLPAIICDIITAYILFNFAKDKIGKNSGALISLFLLLSPVIIVVSCAWAQIDSVFTLALLLTCLLMYNKKTVAASGVWMLALLIKPQALLIAPIIAIILITEVIDKHTRRSALKDIALCIPVMLAVYTAISLPMKGSQSFFYVFKNMLTTTSQYDFASVNAFNLFAMFGGNYIESAKSFLFANYKVFGWIFILLTTLVSAATYSKLRDRKYIFIISGGYLASVFMLAHSMHERYIYPAIILLLFAAVMHNSRRLFTCASALCATSFINIYVSYIYGRAETFIPTELTVAFSAAAVAVFIWLIITIKNIVNNEDTSSLKYELSNTPSFKERSLIAAKNRLSLSYDNKSRLNKKDCIIILAITAAYALVAFTNLGSTNIPDEAYTLNNEGDSIIIELCDEDKALNMWYYAGYCEGDFSIEYSSNAEDFYYCGETVHHEYYNMFCWQSAYTDCRAKYMRITLISGYMEFREIGFSRSDGTFIEPMSAKYHLSNGNTFFANDVIDEFDELPHNGTSYMTDMYFDEIYHARTAYEYIHGIYPYEITHPPLGKAFIALGCEIFGFNPFGWRFMGALAGVLMLPVLYVFAKKLFKATRWAAFSAALFSVEFMHYVQTRIATIDSYSVLFIMLMYLCMYEYMQHNLLKEKLSKTLLPLGLCGLFFALGAATKWICLYAAPGLCFLFFYTVYQRQREISFIKVQGEAGSALLSGYSSKLTLTIIFCIGVFILLPILIYIASYYPYYNACAGNYTLKDVWENQVYMLSYHGNLSGNPHPYQSSVYTWPFIIRPVFFFLAQNLPNNMRAVIWCIGNPLIFIGGTVLSAGLIGIKSEPKKKLTGIPLICLALACQLLPWVIITREVFIYHFFAAVPLLILLITYFMRYICDKYPNRGKYFAVGFLLLSALLFALFYPAITGTQMPVWYARLLKWYASWPITL